MTKGLFIRTGVGAETADYYVDKLNGSASDSNAGTEPALPWLTIGKAATTLTAGQKVLVGPGGTYSETITPSNSGSSGNFITYKAASGTRPIVTGGFQLINRHYIHVEGFETNAGIRATPVSGTPASNLKVINNYLHNLGSGVHGMQMRASDVLISGNTFDGITGDMIRIHGYRCTVRNNTVISETDSLDIHMDFFQSFNGVGGNPTSAGYILIENNLFVDISGGNAHFIVVNGNAAPDDPAEFFIIRHNKVRNLGGMAIFIDDNAQATNSARNSIYNNTFKDMAGGTFASWQDYVGVLDGADDFGCFNNLCHNAMDTGSARGWYFGSKTGCVADYNLYYDPSATITFIDPAASEAGAVKNTDPLMVDPDNNDFTLQSGSPARNAGGPLTTVAAADTGTGTSLVLTDAKFFAPGWGGADPDWIAVGTVTNVVQIASIDYGANTVTLANSISRSDGDSVWLYKRSDGTRVLYGSAPDIGAEPYVE